MNLAGIGIKQPIGVLMVVIGVILIGFIAVSETPIDLYPDIDLPVVMIATEYEGAGPEEVENMVTSHLEDALSTVDGIDTIMSTSRPGESEIIIRFDWGTDMDFAALEVREMVDMVMEELPDEIGRPSVIQLDPDMLPVIQAGIEGDLEDQEMTELAENVLASRIERLEGVALVEVAGGVEREIQIQVDPYKLSAYEISLEELGELIYASNADVSGGEIQDGRREYLIEVEGEFETVEEIEQLIVTESGGIPIRLKEIAEVKDTTERQRPITKINGDSTVSLSVRKESEANTVDVANVVQEEFDELEEELPEDIRFDVAMDQSEFIEASISTLVNMGVSGAIVAMVVLWLFLGNIRSTIIIGIAIPISVIATFNLIYFQEYTLNFITLGGLALGIGMMVDSAIVILENIFRKREEGLPPVDAAIEGSKEVTSAIIAATITSVIAFLPIVFVEGVASIVFAPLAWTVTFALVSSLIVASGVIPLMTTKFIGTDVNLSERSNKITKIFDQKLQVMTEKYEYIIEWGLNSRKLIGTIFVVVLFVTLSLIPLVGFEFLPPLDTGEISVNIETPVGMPIEQTEAVIGEYEEMLMEITEVETVFTSIGGGGLLDDEVSNVGSIEVELVDESERDKETTEVVEDIREEYPRIPGVSVTVTEKDLAAGAVGLDDDIDISVRGDDLETLEKLTEEIAETVRSIEGTEEVSTSFEELAPQLTINMNRDQALTHGLTPYQTGAYLNTALSGQLVSLYREDGEEFNMEILMEHPEEWDLATIDSFFIQNPQGNLVPLEEIADTSVGEAPRDIERQDQLRSGNVTGLIEGRDLGSVMDDIQDELAKKDLPTGYNIEYMGIYRDTVEAFEELTLALGLSVILVYMVMASQFGSLLYPFIIMFTIPLTMLGVVSSLLITGRTFSLVAFIGVIMLAGIVVNNGIVMVDYINLLYKERGYSRHQAVVEAGKKRLRPILMTTSTTIIGMVPLALGIGEGAEAIAPMATVTIGGLLVSTLLTLIIIPVIYTMMDDVSIWLASRRTNTEQQTTSS
ncbi:efflux RND transporter permease subunit [Natranaerobius thermophilus]|uniref:Acriflavin resistance protein n=1 Tax=Natranaerobius thermophilus (strain ATCC BAA-1301 / DSM 18059 / JW/NM-WN-LF) TaxID=457570 RepID=B2A6H5_NATTJ|nr:efflux RND transporter permease subunit [Natranaerobius thermophilus]ACB85508.1 acriflavin resistance protein [Natranaerobius thermophilus JW/NM-WN-LF]